jgi:thiol-disulfide isomerase/thioredoxin
LAIYTFLVRQQSNKQVKAMHKIFVVILAVFALCGALAPQAQAQGKTELVSSQDIVKIVSQAKGKVVVVNFWASWCPPCRQEIPDFIAVRKRIPEDKMLLIGVSIDQDPAMFSTFSAKAGFNYPVYLAKGDVASTFSIRAIPRTMIYSPKGELAVSHDGYLSGEDLEAAVKKLLGS